jgi:hypothetical protein
MNMSDRRGRLSGKTARSYLVFFLAWLLLTSPFFEAGAWAVEPDILRLDFIKLKSLFETEAKKTTEQKVLASLALKTTALSWAMAAANLSGAEKFEEPRWSAKIMNFERSWESTKNWDERELAALEFYYEAMSDMARILASRNRQIFFLEELEKLSAKTAETLLNFGDKADGGLERRVIISGALAGVTSLAVRSVGGGAMERPAQLVIKDMINKANDISERPDAHYRAKLSLLYANNAQGLTSLVFLLGHNAEPALNRELTAVRGAWNRHGAGGALPDAMSLSWAAQAQASLPLAYWLATRWRPES